MAYEKRQDKYRQKSFDVALEMKLQHKIQQLKLHEYQKSMANNAAKKQERIYERNIERDKIEIEKGNKADYMRHFPGGSAGYGNYGISQGNIFQQKVTREIEVKQADSDNSVSVTNDNY